jgi:putative transposase
LLFCQHYIELNPVRAGMVTDPANYRWSSYRTNGLGQPDPLLTAHPLYLALGTDDEARRAAYRDLFRIALDDAPLSDLRMALNQGQPIGSDRFCQEIKAMTGKRRALRKRCRPRKRKDDDSEEESGQAELPLCCIYCNLLSLALWADFLSFVFKHPHLAL